MNPTKNLSLFLSSLIALLTLAHCSDEKKDDSAAYLAVLALASGGPAVTTTLAVSGFNKPEAIGVHSADGTIYVADTKNNQIKKITKELVVSTFLDTNGLASSPLESPEGLCVDSSGNVFVNNTDRHNIIRITAAGVSSNYAGLNNTSATTNGAVANARFNGPEGIFCGSSNTFYVADVGNNQIRKIESDTVTLFAGSSAGTAGYLNGSSTASLFNAPKGIAVDSAGNVFVADNNNHAIRKISSTGEVSLLAGSSSGISGSTDGTGSSARFNKPYALTIDSSGNIYVTDSSNHSIRKITQAGVVTTVAGSGTAGSADGSGTAATLNDPRGITIDSLNRIMYVSCAGDNKIRRIVNY